MLHNSVSTECSGQQNAGQGNCNCVCMCAVDVSRVTGTYLLVREMQKQTEKKRLSINSTPAAMEAEEEVHDI